MVTIDDHARALADAVDRALPAWVVACVDGIYRAWSGTTPPAVLDDARNAGRAAQADVGTRVRALLALDVDQQGTTPLTLLRQAVVYPTGVLQRAGVPPVVRDDYAQKAFPGDDYGLSPSTWADINPELQDFGMAWGAAKAWEHRRRRKGIVAFVPNLMDRSKVASAAPSTRFVSKASALVELAGATRLAVVDLGRPEALAAVGALSAAGVPSLGFASHVDHELMAAARAAGCTQVLARSAFFARLPDLLEG